MKQLALSIALCLLVLTPSFAQDKIPRQLRQLETDWLTASLNGDEAWLERFLRARLLRSYRAALERMSSADFAGTDAHGNFRKKPDWLRSVANLPVAAGKTSDLDIRIHTNQLAIVTGSRSFTLGQAAYRFRFTETWIRSVDEWVCAAMHMSLHS